jgi:hypothetical protein
VATPISLILTPILAPAKFLAVLGLAMDTNMKATLCEQTLDNAYKAYPMLSGAILHSDRDTQYTIHNTQANYIVKQSINMAFSRV